MGIAYLYFIFSSFFNAVISTVLGILVYFKDRRNKANKTFALFCLGVALWAFPYILWPLARTADDALFAFRLLHIAASYVSVFYLFFVVSWLDLYTEKKWIIYVGFLTSTFFAVNVFSPLFITGVAPKFSMRFWAEPGILYHFYLLNFFALFGYACYLLYKVYKKEEIAIRKMQIKLVMTGVLIAFLAGSTNYFLFYNINFPPYGNILVSTFVILTAYAIMKYKLLNIKLITAEGLLLLMNLFIIFRFIISKDIINFAANGIVLAGSLILSYILLKSIKKEIKRREEITELAASLEKAKHQLEEANAEKVAAISMVTGQLQNSQKSGLTALNKQQLINFISAFIEMSRLGQKENFHFRPVDVNKMMEKIITAFVKHAAGKSLPTIKCEPITDTEGLKLDEEKISQAVIILLDNALKYGQGEEIIINTARRKFGLTVFVVDGGMGFAKEEYDKFFHQPYRNAQAIALNPYGTGLSLCIVRQIVEAHGGEMWAHSRGLGKGSEFGFWVPGEEKYPWH